MLIIDRICKNGMKWGMGPNRQACPVQIGVWEREQLGDGLFLARIVVLVVFYPGFPQSQPCGRTLSLAARLSLMRAWGTVGRNGNDRLTVPLDIDCNDEPKASHPTISAISWISVFVSRAVASLDRSCESFARRHGCGDTCTLVGNG